MTETKFCRDCRMSEKELRTGSYFCTSPNLEPDIVTGQRRIVCRVVRHDPSECGPSAKWFEPRPGPDEDPGAGKEKMSLGR